MCGGGSAPGKATSSTNANSPPVSLPVVLIVTNSLFDTQNESPSPDGRCVMLKVDVLLCLASSQMIPSSVNPPITNQKRRNQRAGEREPTTDQHHGAEPGDEGLIYGVLDLRRRPCVHALWRLGRA